MACDVLCSLHETQFAAAYESLLDLGVLEHSADSDASLGSEWLPPTSSLDDRVPPPGVAAAPPAQPDELPRPAKRARRAVIINKVHRTRAWTKAHPPL